MTKLNIEITEKWGKAKIKSGKLSKLCIDTDAVAGVAIVTYNGFDDKYEGSGLIIYIGGKHYFRDSDRIEISYDNHEDCEKMYNLISEAL